MSLSTGDKIDLADWDAKKSRPKSSLRGRADLVNLRQKLDDWEGTVTGLYREDGGMMTPEEFNQELKYRLGIEVRTANTPTELLPYLQAFIAQQKGRNGATKTTWGKFEALYSHLVKFAAETKQTVDFRAIDWKFKDQFLKWMFDPPRSFSVNNASKLVVSLKTVLRDAYRKEVHTNRIFEDPAFTLKRVKTKNKVRLTVDELKRIEHFDFQGDKTLEQVRDLMLFACWTGLRISDWHGIGRRNFKQLNGVEYIETTTQKTKTPVLIPVVPQVARIFDRYDYKLPSLSDQYFNRVVKEVCKLAIPEATFSRVYSKGGEQKKELSHKWEFVSSHSGRRSFASNLYEATQRAYPIMQITGHSSEKVFFDYIDLKREKAMSELASPLIDLANQ